MNGSHFLFRLGTVAGLFLVAGCASSPTDTGSNPSAPSDAADLPQQALTGQQLSDALLEEGDFDVAVKRETNPVMGQLLSTNPGSVFAGLEAPDGADLTSEQQDCLNALTTEPPVVTAELDAAADAVYSFEADMEAVVALSSSSVESPNTASAWAERLEPCQDVDPVAEGAGFQFGVELETLGDDYTQVQVDFSEDGADGTVTIGVHQFGNNALVMALGHPGTAAPDGDDSLETLSFEQIMERQLAALETVDIGESAGDGESGNEPISRQAAYAVSETRFDVDNYELDMTITTVTGDQEPVTETTERIGHPRVEDQTPSTNYTDYAAQFERVQTPDQQWEHYRAEPGRDVYRDDEGWHSGAPRRAEGNVSNNGAYRSVAASIEHIWQDADVSEADEGLLIEYSGPTEPMRLPLTFDVGESAGSSFHHSEVEMDIFADPETLYMDQAHLRIYAPSKDSPETTWDIELDYSSINSAPAVEVPEDAQSLLDSE